MRDVEHYPELDFLGLGAKVRTFEPDQKLLDRYVLRRLLGSGDLGAAWLAYEEPMAREVVLRFLPEIVRRDAESFEEIKEETRHGLDLIHPHIVRVYDYVGDDTFAAIVMEYVDGHTLSVWRQHQPTGFFEVQQIREWTMQILDALDYAHLEMKFLHRDLKPDNLLVSEARELKIAGFGTSRTIINSLIRLSGKGGTPEMVNHMSPQLALGGEPTVQDDIYALGATIYELLTGKPPFLADAGDVLAQMWQVVPPSMAKRRRELNLKGARIPEEWESTVAACLAKDPAARPQGIAETAERLGFKVAPIPVVETKAPAEVIEEPRPDPIPEPPAPAPIEPAPVIPEPAPAASLPVPTSAPAAPAPVAPEPVSTPAPASTAPVKKSSSPVRGASKPATTPAQPATHAPAQAAAPTTAPLPAPVHLAGSPKSSRKKLPSKDWMIVIGFLVLFVLDILGYYIFFRKPVVDKTQQDSLVQEVVDAKMAAAEAQKQKADEVAARSRADEEKAALAKAKQDAEARATAAEQAAQQAKADAEKAKQAEQAALQKVAAALGPVAGQAWTNSLGVKFVPAGTEGILFSIWDVRVKDYAAFVTATGHDWGKPNFPQTENDPAVKVSWNDAQAFCEWLTKREQDEGRLGANQKYRLPTDKEWSKAAGLNETNWATPKGNDGGIKDVYPWGTEWPPPTGAGNYAESLTNDGFPKTSPVGTFGPNPFGLFDMGGNVWQWCDDKYDNVHDWRVLRGGSWVDRSPQSLLSSSRSGVGPTSQDDGSGFRVVVVAAP